MPNIDDRGHEEAFFISIEPKRYFKTIIFLKNRRSITIHHHCTQGAQTDQATSTCTLNQFSTDPIPAEPIAPRTRSPKTSPCVQAIIESYTVPVHTLTAAAKASYTRGPKDYIRLLEWLRAAASSLHLLRLLINRVPPYHCHNLSARGPRKEARSSLSLPLSLRLHNFRGCAPGRTQV